MRKLIALLVLVLCAASAKAGITNCNTSPGLESDGRAVVNDFVGTSSTNYYFIHVLVGHSYTVEVTNHFTAFGTILALGLVDGACGATTQAFTNTTSFDPNLGGTNGARISFVAAATGALNATVANSSTSTGVTYDIRMADTTLHNPRWSTFGTFITQYGFRNTTPTAISATLTVTTTLSAGTAPAPQTITFSVPAGSEIFKVVSPTGDVAIAANNAGFADLVFVGPPGAIIADAYFINSSATVIVPNSFGPRDYQY